MSLFKTSALAGSLMSQATEAGEVTRKVHDASVGAPRKMFLFLIYLLVKVLNSIKLTQCLVYVYN
jgi:hypothetical protein